MTSVNGVRGGRIETPGFYAFSVHESIASNQFLSYRKMKPTTSPRETLGSDTYLVDI